VLALSTGAAGAAQTRGKLLISPACFDSLPYGLEHACVVRYPNTTKASLGALYTSVATLVVADSLLIARRDSADSAVAILVDPQVPHGPCARSSGGSNWISPTIAVRFVATRRGKKQADFLVSVRGAAVSTEGNVTGGMSLALCYLAIYAFPLDSLPAPNDGP
jgi:hypothetical protein